VSDYPNPVDFISGHTGLEYKEFLARLHKFLKPRSYLEIGSRTGDSLSLASCASIAIDPDFNLAPNFMGLKQFCCLYRMTSDVFFSEHDATAILGRPIDLAFLDGLHLAEFLVRDFINVERHCKRNSVIAIHDCLPLDSQMARRRETDPNKGIRQPGWWTGDVWKVLIILKKYRPSLRVYALDAVQTGLVIVTCLDPESTVLGDNYFNITDEFRSLTSESFADFISQLGIMPTSCMETFEDVSQYFWL